MNTKRALAKMLMGLLEGKYYETQNPYTRQEVKDAFKALGIDQFQHGSTGKVLDIANGVRAKRIR